MDKLVEIKKGQLRIRWPFVKRQTWQSTMADLGKARREGEILKATIEALQAGWKKEKEELEKTIASRIHFHMGNPDTIRVTNEQGLESSLTAAARTHLLTGKDEPSRYRMSDESYVARAEVVCYAHTAPLGEIMAMPEFIIRRMAEVLVHEVIKRWKEKGNKRKVAHC